MKKRIILILIFFILILFGLLDPVYASEIDTLEVGTIVNDTTSIDEYFQSYEIQEGDSIYQRIYGKSFPTDGSVKLESLKYLKMIYYNYEGNTVVGEMIVHTNLASDVLEVFKELYQNKVEIYTMQLIDNFFTSGGVDAADNASMASNNTSSFNYRPITNGSSLSNHAKGMAIDINPYENPYIKGNEVKPPTDDEYISKRESSLDSHVIKKNGIVYQIFTKHGFTWGGDWSSLKDYQHFEKEVDETVSASTSTPQKDSKKILLVAAHGLGKDCNHASTKINGVRYYENKEAREMIDKIANYMDSKGINYEIANEIIGDSYWASDEVERQNARNCPNPEVSNCCGYRTATIGTYSSQLLNHVDANGADKYSMVFELHFNAGGANYSLVMGRNEVLRENGLKIAQKVVDTIGTGSAMYGTDREFYGSTLGTITKFYQQRSIPTYYLETVFMDNQTQFSAYLDHKDELAKALAEVLIELAPNSVGGSSSSKKGPTNGRYVDPYPNIFGRVNLETYDDVGCNTYFFDSKGNETKLKELIDDLFYVIQISIPVIVIILSTIDYVSALLAQDADKVKQATRKMMKRVMIGLIIFFLPMFLDLLFHLFGLYDLGSCGIGGGS